MVWLVRYTLDEGMCGIDISRNGDLYLWIDLALTQFISWCFFKLQINVQISRGSYNPQPLKLSVKINDALTDRKTHITQRKGPFNTTIHMSNVSVFVSC